MRKVKPLQTSSSSAEAIAGWFQSELGTQVLDTQQAILEQLLPQFFGYHLLQLSVQEKLLTQSSAINHQFTMGTSSNSDSTFKGDQANLPFEDNSIDVVLLHHLLDSSQSPQRLLSEVGRVSLPMGHVVIVGFNPMSLWGAWKPIGSMRGRAPWQANFISPTRLMDWLNLLNFKIDRAHYCTYGIPRASDRSTTDYSQGLSRNTNWPFGAVYVIVARKQTGSMIPMKPIWSDNRGFGQLSVVRPARPVSGREISTRNVPTTNQNRDLPGKD